MIGLIVGHERPLHLEPELDEAGLEAVARGIRSRAGGARVARGEDQRGQPGGHRQEDRRPLIRPAVRDALWRRVAGLDRGVWFAMPIARAATGLRQESDGADLDPALDPLDHVVDRQRGHGSGRQRLHLHAGRSGRGRLGADPQPTGCAVGRDLDEQVGQRQWVTQRDQLGGPLGCHDAGELGDRQDIALRTRAVDDGTEGLGRDDDERLRDGPARCRWLGAHVDHPRSAGPVDMGQSAALGPRCDGLAPGRALVGAHRQVVGVWRSWVIGRATITRPGCPARPR